MIVGYARVSTDGQSLEAQQAALTAAGCERVFAEKISGAQNAMRVDILGSRSRPFWGHNIPIWQA
jgi:DNA invertase Pin-like site-specific DNA recombinase